jgi:hypothetical protein
LLASDMVSASWRRTCGGTFLDLWVKTCYPRKQAIATFPPTFYSGLFFADVMRCRTWSLITACSRILLVLWWGMGRGMSEPCFNINLSIKTESEYQRVP